MQKWEYHIVNVDENSVAVKAINGEFTRKPSFHDYIASLGDEGWELVGMGQGVWVFKRPKA